MTDENESNESEKLQPGGQLCSSCKRPKGTRWPCGNQFHDPSDSRMGL